MAAHELAEDVVGRVETKIKLGEEFTAMDIAWDIYGKGPGLEKHYDWARMAVHTAMQVLMPVRGYVERLVQFPGGDGKAWLYSRSTSLPMTSGASVPVPAHVAAASMSASDGAQHILDSAVNSRVVPGGVGTSQQKTGRILTSKPITMIGVTSSLVKAIGHHAGLQILRVTLRDGHDYDYANVSAAEAVEFLGAKSKGQYYNTVIKRRHDRSSSAS